ncbi:MAG TPA: LuxR C-terminal-related transcriptional regulator, partial [Steroidobacteraceae bacterium]
MKHGRPEDRPDARVHGVDMADRGPVDFLARAREAFESHSWRDAYEAYLAADAAAGISGDDLDHLAIAACLVGRERDFLAYKERAHRAHVAANRAQRAARDAFWLALFSMFRGEIGQANAWVARGERLIAGSDCAERGYLAMITGEVELHRGGFARAWALAAEAAALGERCVDADLVAAARHQQGRAAIKLGRAAEGLKLLDQTMLEVIAGDLSPIMTGLMYCSIIDVCRSSYEWNRAREWTVALSRWCDRQAGMVAFTDACFVHRAEILCLQGAWADALTETHRVCDRREHCDRPPLGAAFYQQGEIHRLRGEATPAEECFRAASRHGFDPQPGLALLRLSQGRTDAAAAAMRRLLGATSDPVGRGRILPAHVEIMLAVDEIEEALRACEELEALSSEYTSEMVRAQAAHARGAWCARTGDPHAAIGHLRDAFTSWMRFDAPYEAARVRVLIADACGALGDVEARTLELDAARQTFEQLGARADLERLEQRRAGKAGTHKLSARELEVLRLVARGQTNKVIARDLGLSD